MSYLFSKGLIRGVFFSGLDGEIPCGSPATLYVRNVNVSVPGFGKVGPVSPQRVESVASKIMMKILVKIFECILFTSI